VPVPRQVLDFQRGGLLYVQWIQLRWEVIVRFVDVGGIYDQHCLNFLSRIATITHIAVLYIRLPPDCSRCLHIFMTYLYITEAIQNHSNKKIHVNCKIKLEYTTKERIKCAIDIQRREMSCIYRQRQRQM